MCGIVCVIGKDSKTPLFKEYTDIFKQMLYADALRGWDSTGIASIRQNNTVLITKDACSPSGLFSRNPDNTWITGNQALVGHNRAATRGASTINNAHPFKEEHITLVHNGTLRFHRHLKAVEVDSHAITHAIAEKGAKETLEQLNGAFALVWFDEKTNLLYAARNSERPLYVIETNEVFILASEYELAEWICARNNKVPKKVQLLTAGLIYSFRTNKKGMRYLQTSRFTPYTYVQPKAMPFSSPVNDDDDPFQRFKSTLPNNVTAIAPYKKAQEDEEGFHGLKVGMSIDVLAFKEQRGFNYTCYGLGNTRWIAESLEYPDIVIEVYTNSKEDFSESIINITIERLYFSPALNQHYAIGKNPTIPKKKQADASGPMRTSNGIELTDKVIELCANKYCEDCATDFVAEPGMTLVPIIKRGHTYNYRYHCAECTAYSLDRKIK